MLDLWTVKPNVPLGGGKALKEGTSTVAVQRGDTNFIYLLKGSGTTEFYRFHISPSQWETMLSLPMEKNKGFKNGSGLVYDSDAKRIYVLKGSYNLFYAYDLDANTWNTRDSLPLRQTPGGSKKKVKDGAGLAYHNGVIYALKGGNTNEFWCYKCDSNDWTNLTDITGAIKRVKGGGALVYAPSTDALYALKGNNTRGFYMYWPLAAFGTSFSANSNEMANSSTLQLSNSLRVAPNPFTNAATIAYSLPKAGNASLKLYDVTGKLVSVLAQGYVTAGSHSARVEAATLAHGIYLLKLTTEGYSTTKKLILE